MQDLERQATDPATSYPANTGAAKVTAIPNTDYSVMCSLSVLHLMA